MQWCDDVKGVAFRVEGALQGLAVRQVECGLNLTVALTTDGRIWQMGETGAPGTKHTPWEGAREPQQVGYASAAFVGNTSKQKWPGTAVLLERGAAESRKEALHASRGILKAVGHSCRCPFQVILWSAYQSACSMSPRLLGRWMARPEEQRYASSL